MTLVKRNNGGLVPFRSLLADLFDTDGFFDESLGNKSWVPAVNVSETDTGYDIEMAVPGMKKSDFNIKLEKRILTVSAEHREEQEEKKKNYMRQEYSYNSFSRSFAMPDDVKEEEVKASYENGVLKLALLKKVPGTIKPKQIEVA